MEEMSVRPEAPKPTEEQAMGKPANQKKQPWQTPKLEDVSEQVMAQPYIRFT